MIELTENAEKELKTFFLNNPTSAPKVRIFSAMGCSGPMLRIALDEPNAEDATEDLNEITFCINKSLIDIVKSVKIDLTYMGFVVEPEVPLPVPEGFTGGCTSCSGCH